MKMKERLKLWLYNDKGIAWAIFFVFGMFVSFTFLWIVLTPVVNEQVFHFNSEVEQGYVSQQTKNVVEFNVNFFVASLVLFLIGISYWGWQYAAEKRTGEG